MARKILIKIVAFKKQNMTFKWSIISIYMNTKWLLVICGYWLLCRYFISNDNNNWLLHMALLTTTSLRFEIHLPQKKMNAKTVHFLSSSFSSYIIAPWSLTKRQFIEPPTTSSFKIAFCHFTRKKGGPDLLQLHQHKQNDDCVAAMLWVSKSDLYPHFVLLT